MEETRPFFTVVTLSVEGRGTGWWYFKMLKQSIKKNLHILRSNVKSITTLSPAEILFKTGSSDKSSWSRNASKIVIICHGVHVLVGLQCYFKIRGWFFVIFHLYFSPSFSSFRYQLKRGCFLGLFHFSNMASNVEATLSILRYFINGV